MTRSPQVLPDAASLAEAAAGLIAAAAAGSVKVRDRFTVGLAGGSTPRDLYRLLASDGWRSRIPWKDTHVFWGDERCVSPEDPESNFAMAQETLLSSLELPSESIHRIPGELGQEEAVAAYKQELLDAFPGYPPRLDVLLLGLGEDGHTASLFPGSPDLGTEQIVVATRSPEPPHERVSLSLRTINAARCLIFLVTGEEKAGVLRRVLEGPDGSSLPAARVRPIDGELHWLVDRDAASRISG